MPLIAAGQLNQLLEGLKDKGSNDASAVLLERPHLPPLVSEVISILEHLCRDEGAPASRTKMYVLIRNQVWSLRTGPKRLIKAAQLGILVLPVWHSVLPFQRKSPLQVCLHVQ